MRLKHQDARESAHPVDVGNALVRRKSHLQESIAE